MSTKTLTFILLGTALFGCSSGKSSGGSGTTGGCNTDYATIAANAPPISLTNDLMPIFGLSCTQSECHNVNDPQHKAGLVLGVKCKFNASMQAVDGGVNPKWTCEFPTTAGTDPVADPQPLTPAIVDEVYKNLLLASQTVTSVKRVAPSDDEHSFLLDKLANRQNQQPYASQCQNQDPTKSSFPCGDKMPLTGAVSLCEDDPPRFDAIAQWVAQGAKEN